MRILELVVDGLDHHVDALAGWFAPRSSDRASAWRKGRSAFLACSRPVEGSSAPSYLILPSSSKPGSGTMNDGGFNLESTIWAVQMMVAGGVLATRADP